MNTLSRAVYYRDLLRELVSRDLKVRYKRSALGFAWTLANPLMYLTVFYFVFQMAMSINIPRFGPFAFTGILVWNWFQSSLSQAIGAIVHNRELVRTPGFQPAILPAVTIVSNLVHFLLGLVLFILFLVLTDAGPGFRILLLPLFIAIQFTLTLGLAYWLAAANVLFRDTAHLVSVILQLFFFLTPIFYQASMVPEEYRHIYNLNPMVHILDGYRSALLATEVSWSALAIIIGVALVLLLTGYRYFLKLSHAFAEEL